MVDKSTSSAFTVLNNFHLKLKRNIVIVIELYFCCFAKGHLYNVLSTLLDDVKRNVKDNVFRRCPTLLISTLKYVTLIRGCSLL